MDLIKVYILLISLFYFFRLFNLSSSLSLPWSRPTSILSLSLSQPYAHAFSSALLFAILCAYTSFIPFICSHFYFNELNLFLNKRNGDKTHSLSLSHTPNHHQHKNRNQKEKQWKLYIFLLQQKYHLFFSFAYSYDGIIHVPCILWLTAVA